MSAAEKTQHERESAGRAVARAISLFKDWFANVTAPLRHLLSAPFRADALYRARHTLWPWLWMLLLSLSIISGALMLIDAAIQSERFGGKSTLWTGVWTLVLALGAAPFAWYTWLIRDRNKHEDQRQQASIAAREHFNKLREWATAEEVTRRVAALFELQEYLHVDRNIHRVPEIIADEREEYRTMAARFFSELLRDRLSWDGPLREREEELKKARGPKAYLEIAGKELEYDGTRAALERILRESASSIEDLGRTDLRYFNLERGDLRDVNLMECDLRFALLNSADLKQSSLLGTDLRYAHLISAHPKHTRLQYALLNNSDLSFTKLNCASLQNARLLRSVWISTELKKTNLNKANLNRAVMISIDFTNCKLKGAQFHGARVVRGCKWPPGFDPQAAGILIQNDNGSDSTSASDSHLDAS